LYARVVRHGDDRRRVRRRGWQIGLRLRPGSGPRAKIPLDGGTRLSRRHLADHDNRREVRPEGVVVILLDLVKRQRTHSLRRWYTQAGIILGKDRLAQRALCQEPRAVTSGF